MKTAQSRQFPIELLYSSAETRVKYFKDYRIDHPNLTRSFKKAMSAINSECGAKVVLVAGPSGAGKSTLAGMIHKELIHQYSDLIAQDPGIIPVSYINAIPPNGSSFSWKDFYIRLLERQGDVLLDRKMLTARQHDLFEGMLAPLPIERTTTEALRRAAERCLKFRKTKVLIIDEAHHILMVNDPRRLEFQFEALKSLTIESDIIIVLVGTYRLLAIRDQSGQLVRRSEIIHFPRYGLDTNKDDNKNFFNALRQLQQQLPLPTTPNLTSTARYFYTKSGGSIGILKEWLSRCLKQAILQGKETFDAVFADEFALSNKSLITILDEAIEGELSLEDASLKEVQALLYRIAAKAAPQPTPENLPVKKSVPKGARKVGERKPIRDKTGDDHEKH